MGSSQNEGPLSRQKKKQNLGQVREVQKLQRVKEGTVFSQLLITVQKLQIRHTQLPIHHRQRGTFMCRSYFQLTGIHYIWTLTQAGARRQKSFPTYKYSGTCPANRSRTSRGTDLGMLKQKAKRRLPQARGW